MGGDGGNLAINNGGKRQTLRFYSNQKKTNSKTKLTYERFFIVQGVTKNKKRPIISYGFGLFDPRQHILRGGGGWGNLTQNDEDKRQKKKNPILAHGRRPPQKTKKNIKFSIVQNTRTLEMADVFAQRHNEKLTYQVRFCRGDIKSNNKINADRIIQTTKVRDIVHRQEKKHVRIHRYSRDSVVCFFHHTRLFLSSARSRASAQRWGREYPG